MRTKVEDRLQEIESAIYAIEAQLAAMKDILSSMRNGGCAAADFVAGDPLDIIIDDVDFVPIDTEPAPEPEAVSGPEVEAAPEMEAEAEAEAVPEIETEPEVEAVPEIETEPEAEPEPEPEPEPEATVENMPLFEDLSEVIPVKQKKLAVLDIVPATPSWRTDRVGAPVKNILSAISLNDRISFISGLFHKDPLLFQSTLNRINAMNSFEEAEDYILSNFSDWKLESDSVYRFMMAVRRRFN